MESRSMASTKEEVLDAKPLRTLSPMFPGYLGINTVISLGPWPCLRPRSIFFGTPAGSGSAETESPGYTAQHPSSQMPADPLPVSTRNRAADTGESSGINVLQNVVTTLQSTQNTPFSGGDDLLIKAPPEVSCKQKNCVQPQLSSTEACSSGADDRKNKKIKLNKKPVVSHKELLVLSSSSHDARERLEDLLMKYDSLRRRLTLIDEMNGKGLRLCPHLKAGTIIKDKNPQANPVRRIGHVPGVEIGDIFYYRAEMELIGLHIQSMSGIDWMIVKFEEEEDPVALSIVSSGGYDDTDDDVNILIFSGQGGKAGRNKNGEKKLPSDQKLEKGNLALLRSSHRSNEIRVIRSENDITGNGDKIYIYDGLYKLDRFWGEKGDSGLNQFKCKLLRQPDQPDGIAVWKRTQKWIKDPSSRGAVIIPDISYGIENTPVCLVNDVDDEKGLCSFEYATKVNYLIPVNFDKPLQACICGNICLPENANCSCFKKNGGEVLFSSNGVLVFRRPLVYECGDSCSCIRYCRNRVTQNGIKLHFEVFRTRNRGWGLRSWDPIRSGTFICEYIGHVIEKIEVDENETDNTYIFHARHTDDKSFNWNYGQEFHDISAVVKPDENFRPLHVILCAKRMGNISRFMNHSCSPNVFWQPVLHDHSVDAYPHIMFFAIKHIPPMTELTYDYGINSAGTGKEEIGSGTKSCGQNKCLCGSPKCRGFL